jgi:hopene-associated glycosyltransferase HpnB
MDLSYAGFAIAALPAVIWFYLLFARGRFWQITPNLAPEHINSTTRPTVAVIIPARNEAEVIAKTVSSLLTQDFDGPCHVFVIDDSSTDNTATQAVVAAEAAEREHALTVIQAPPLPSGWTGKMWALSHGVGKALAVAPDFLLLTDADICHEPQSLRKLIGIAEAGPYDLVSLMVKLHCQTFAERALIPAFVFYFFLLYPPAWIRNKKRITGGAAGGCMLIKPSTLAQAGGIEAIRAEIIDDCALARRVKHTGGRVWLGLTANTYSTRSYQSFSEIERMISRTAFRQLNHSALLLTGTLAGLAIIYVLPIALCFSGQLVYALLGITAWVLMAAAYLPMVRFYGQAAIWALALPAITVFYAFSTLHSALKYWSGSGGQWKGRAQDV